MFVGAVPKPAIEQITRVVPFDNWRNVFVGCSGSFRFDRAVKDTHPGVKVFSNDVSLLSCGIGALATGKTFPLEFKDRLAFFEPLLDGATFKDRIAAVVVGLEMAKYKGDNAYAASHFAHYRAHFHNYLNYSVDKLTELLAGLHIEDYQACDFRRQVARAVKEGGGIAAFPPTYKGGYERLYRFVDDNVTWPAPDYDVWDPQDLDAWVAELAAAGVRYCIIADRRLEGVDPVTVYRSPTNKPVYAYSDNAKASVRRSVHRSEPFRYRPLDPATLTARSEVTIVPMNSAQMNFLKDKYLAKGIAHVAGMTNFVVMIDGNLVGGFIYTRSRMGELDAIYLLSDFSIVHERRLSKLVSLLATSKTVLSAVEHKHVMRIRYVKTTAFTDKPVSMKYRGVFKLANRKPGMLNYASEVRDQTPAQIYRQWFRKYAQDKDRPRQAA